MTPEKEAETLKRLELLEEAVAGLANVIESWLDVRARLDRPPSLESCYDLLNAGVRVIRRNMVETEGGG